MTTTIKINTNGSLEVDGDVEVVDASGTVLKKKKKDEKVWLCRCGHSKNKPFCDGAHKVCGFEG